MGKRPKIGIVFPGEFIIIVNFLFFLIIFFAVPTLVKLTVTDGAAVDPEAFEEVPHGSTVITDPGTGRLYTSMMSMVDLKRDKNSYYKLQGIWFN